MLKHTAIVPQNFGYPLGALYPTLERCGIYGLSLKSPTQTVLIGPDQPFAIIGERINPTGRKKLVAKGRPIINSVTGEEDRLETILPVVAEYNVPVIAISNDESGISYDPKVRFGVAKKIVKRAESYGIKPEDVLIDPLAMPVGAIASAGYDLFTLVRMIRDELGCNTICGASNISFGMPNRALLNATFIAMAIAAGMPCAITNPLEQEIRNTVYAADVLMGHDPKMNYLMAMRKLAAQQNAAAHGTGTEAAPNASDERRAARDARRSARRER